MKLARPNTCSGCGACVNICPNHCISMVEDKLGFLKPNIDLSCCVDCMRCSKICPIINDGDGASPTVAYASWSQRYLTNSPSTSGGIAHELSSYIIQNGGVVYGCAYVDGSVKHIRVENLTDLEQLRGSKYVQSNTSHIFSEVKKDLEKGLTVLFTGVPCQVYGLKRFIGKNNDRLLLLDILCHGVPSQKMLSDHIKHVSKGRIVKSISFRDGTDYIFRVNGDGWAHESRYLHDAYIAGFLHSCTLRDSCINCKFTKPARYSDITIGDFWGLGKSNPIDFNTKPKTSLVLPITDKGFSLIENIKENIIIHERPISEAIEGNYPLREPPKQTLNYRLFHTLYKQFPFEWSVTISLLDKYLFKLFHRLSRFLIKHRIKSK